jgi:hypothetical protein
LASALRPSSLEVVVLALIKAERAELAAEAFLQHVAACSQQKQRQHESAPTSATASTDIAPSGSESAGSERACAAAILGLASTDEHSSIWSSITEKLLRACSRAAELEQAEAVWAPISRARALALNPGGSEGGDGSAARAQLDGIAAGALPSLVCAHLRAGQVAPALARLGELPVLGPQCAARSYAEMIRWGLLLTVRC